jgi:MerR family redox-sensitive transcriptional activator SoxR
MTIGELAACSDLKPIGYPLLRKNRLAPGAGTQNGRRIYSAESADRLFLICFAKDTGFSLPEIKLLLHGFPQSTPAGERWRKLATPKIAQLEAGIAKARAMEQMLRFIMKCRRTTLDQCARGLAACAKKRRA